VKAYGVAVFHSKAACLLNTRRRTMVVVAVRQEAAGERGVDVVCEMVASKNLKNDVNLLARKGRVVV